MKNFIFKSTDADFKKMFSIIERIDKNVLYTTYRMDLVNKWIHAQETETNLQKQVDDYFEKDPFGSAFAESVKSEDRQDKD